MPRRVSLLSVAAFAATLGGSALGAQDVRLSTSIVDSIRTATPGAPVTLMFSITSSVGIESGVAEATVPEGWRLITPNGELPGGTRRIAYMVAIRVPSTAAAGRYPINLDARSAAGRSSARAWVIVPEQPSISLRVVESPQMVVAGDEADGLLLLTNSGNVPGTIRVTVRTPAAHSLDTLVVSLRAGESKDIPVRIRTSRNAEGIIQSVTSASAEMIGYEKVAASSSFRMAVAAREAYAAAPIHTLASLIRVIGSSSPRGGSGAEILGSGFVRDGGGAKVEYVARRMNGNGSAFGDRNEYRLAVTSAAFTVIAGDQVSTLSPLSESGRFARGIHAEARSNGWTVGGFINREITSWDKRAERAAFLRRDFGNGVLFGVNYLDRSQSGGGSMLTARAAISSLPIGNVQGEIGHAINSAPSEAWMFSANGRFARLGYSLNRNRTDRDYPGSTRGIDATNASVDATPMDGVVVRGAHNDNRISQRFNAYRFGSMHHWNDIVSVAIKRLVTFDVMRNGRQDQSFSSQPRREEILGGVRLNARLSGVTVVASAAIGTATDSAKSPRDVARYSAQASFRTGSKGNVWLNVESLRGGTLFIPDERSEIRAGAGANLNTRAGQFAVTGYVTQHNLGGSSRDASVDLTWEKILPAGNKLGFRARLQRNSSFESREDNIIRAEYSIPFGMPIGPSRTRGRVAGRVIDADTKSGIQGVVVQLGKQVTITDPKGQFAFSTDSENPMLLTLGGSSSTAGLIPLVDLPATVHPRQGHTESVEVALTPAGRIEGRVRLFVSPPGFRIDDDRPPEESANGPGRMCVTASLAGEVRRACTQASGRFELTGLRPGLWTIRVDDAQLPEHSAVEGDSVSVAVRRGEATVAELRVIPRKRKIRVVQMR